MNVSFVWVVFDEMKYWVRELLPQGMKWILSIYLRFNFVLERKWVCSWFLPNPSYSIFIYLWFFFLTMRSWGGLWRIPQVNKMIKTEPHVDRIKIGLMITCELIVNFSIYIYIYIYIFWEFFSLNISYEPLNYNAIVANIMFTYF